MSWVTELARPEIVALKPYEHASWEPSFERMHANELPWRSPHDESEAGLNRFIWDLRHEDATGFPGLIMWAANLRGPRVVPGSYQVKLTAAGKTLQQTFAVKKDPRIETTPEDFAKQISLHAFVFDVLHLDGVDLLDAPTTERLAALDVGGRVADDDDVVTAELVAMRVADTLAGDGRQRRAGFVIGTVCADLESVRIDADGGHDVRQVADVAILGAAGQDLVSDDDHGGVDDFGHREDSGRRTE